MTRIRPVARRRVLQIAAAAGGLSLAGAGSLFLLRPDKHIKPQRWQGTALGAQASITLYHHNSETGARLIRSAVAEINRLEQIFSIYRADSYLALLNRNGVLVAPPPELVQLLAQAHGYSEVTDGAFDVTVQPLWSLYANHFAQPDADPAGPSDEDIRRALASIDYQAVEIGTERITFCRPEMAVTLNGIAQGWITDRVAELLREGGLENVLVDLGEIRGIGGHPDGQPWTAGLRDPFVNNRIARTVALRTAALATSGGYGYQFDPAGRYNHLFDPRTGLSSNHYASISVLAPTATEADAVSTALASTNERDLPSLSRGLKHVTAIFTRRDGTSFEWHAPDYSSLRDV